MTSLSICMWRAPLTTSALRRILSSNDYSMYLTRGTGDIQKPGVDGHLTMSGSFLSRSILDTRLHFARLQFYCNMLPLILLLMRFIVAETFRELETISGTRQ